VRFALRSAAFAERWFPDAYVFAVLGVVVVAACAIGFGASPGETAGAFGEGFWSLIPFTMQMAFVVIGGYVVATAPVVARFIDLLARVPRSGRGAVAYVGLVSMLASLLSWGFSLVFAGLLVRALARREELRMDYRAAGAAAYLGLGAVWAMGLSSSAAQLQANPASMPPGLVEITGVLPFSETIFLWQSIVLTAALVAAAGASPDVGLGLGGSVYFAAATVLPTVVFLGVAAVASQLARTRHLASTIAMGCFAVSFVVRMLGDAGTGLRWLLWTTPLGWAELVQPFIEDDPWPLLAGLVLALGLCGAAVARSARRDAGAGTFAADESRLPRSFGLGSPIGLAIRLAAPVAAAWTLGIVATAFVFGSVTNSVVQALAGSSTVPEVLARLGGVGRGPAAFLSVEFILLGTILALVPAHHVGMAREEERSGRLALLLAGPIGRRRWLAERIVLGASVVVVLGPLAGLACWAGAVALGADVGLWSTVAAGVGIVPAALVALSVGAAVLAVAPRVASAGVELVVGWSLVIDLLGSLVSGLEPLTRLSLFHSVGRAPATSPDWVAFAVTTGVAVAIAVVAVGVFGWRDLSED
jgi:putative exporter of polyketide antibiotics